jgi:probable F420-dependent oxidoreductase
MRLGVTLRNMGPQSAPETVRDGARAADASGLASLWITDHIAIPPDDAEGSDGRYLDPLITLALLAGITERIRLGTGVLILPYRPPLPTAKQVATLAELSAGRLLLGVGIGWMAAEFRALGLDRRQRGRDADGCLAFLNDCFASDVVEANGQAFLFRPRPARPPIYVGGRAPHALTRAVRYADGWLPMGMEPADLAPELARYDELAARDGKRRGEVIVMRALPLGEPNRCRDLLAEYDELGVAELVCAVRYQTIDEYRRLLEGLAALDDLPG